MNDPAVTQQQQRCNGLLQNIWRANMFPQEDLRQVLDLYEKYRDDLLHVRQQQRELYSIRQSLGLVPQLCDLEAEITYLRLRESRPSTVAEISPASGWSTSWILHALKDNGTGILYSYDLVDDSTHVIPLSLSEQRWKFYKGDVRENMGLLPPRTDYLFIDSDHSGEFANWYIDNLFTLYEKGTKVSVHDILKWSHEPGWGEESLILCSWLAKNKMNCMTAGRALRDKGYDAIIAARQLLDFDGLIHPAKYNSMIFFGL